MSWTDERIEKLEKLWNEGLTASQIAQELGDVTRNAVIGKVHRLGLKSRTKVTRKTATPAASTTKENQEQGEINATNAQETASENTTNGAEAPHTENTAKKVNTESKVIDFEVHKEEKAIISPKAIFVPEHERASILDLNDRRCKWPIGDPMKDDFYYCGKPKDPNKSYCEGHCEVAYQVNERREGSTGR